MEETQSNEDISAIVCEFLEVAIHSIVYHSEVYPSGIFKKCQKYKAVAMMSCFPKLNSYVCNIIGGLQPLLIKNEVEEVLVEFYNTDNALVETYVIEISIDAVNERLSQDLLYQLEQQFRGFLVKLFSQERSIKPLPPGSRFQVKAKCKQGCLDFMSDQVDFQEFPWVVEDTKSDGSTSPAPLIVPLKACHHGPLKLQCYILDRRDSLQVD